VIPELTCKPLLELATRAEAIVAATTPPYLARALLGQPLVQAHDADLARARDVMLAELWERP